MKSEPHSEINKKSEMFMAFKKAQFRSTKHTNFFYIYDDLLKKFKDKKITLVEIGIASGGSLFMWREFFKDNARIIGIDFNKDAKKWEKYGFEIYIGNQSDNFFWKNFYSQVGLIDILVDDGGHTNEQQLVTFHNSYNNISEDGILIFEDTHASYLKEFGNPSKYSFINFCKKIIDLQNEKSIKNHEKFNYLKKIHRIDFFQALVAIHINKYKATKNNSIINDGKIVNSEDFRLRDIKIFDKIETNKNFLRKIINPKIYLSLKKIYPFIKFIFFKIRNLKNIKYFR